MSAVDRASRGVARWVRLYTGGLGPTPAAERREEVAADVRDQIEWSRDAGESDADIARALRRRALRGAPADLAWALGAALRTPSPGIEHPLRVVVAGTAAALAALGIVSLARRPIAEAPTEAFALLLGVVIALGALALLARTRTRAIGALWVVAAAQILLLDGVAYLAASTTILANVVESSGWSGSILLADLGIGVLCLTSAAWWATGDRVGAAR